MILKSNNQNPNHLKDERTIFNLGEGEYEHYDKHP